MLLTISTTHRPATDLGFLLHKHPDRFQSFSLAVGTAHVGYPDADEGRCTAALVLDIDPIELSRRRRGGGRTLYEYVNDRPYVASSFLSVAIAKVFGSALKGRCDTRPELVQADLPLEVEVAVVRCVDGEAFIRALFEPLGYAVQIQPVPLDPAFPTWGSSDLFVLQLSARVPLQAMLGHLYVLLPVLDDAKHYWVDSDEIDKLLRYGADWLADHPQREAITHRYLKRHRHLSRAAVQRLEEDAGTAAEDREDDDGRRVDVPRLRDVRLEAVAEQLRASGATSVVDLGCGAGALLQRLLPETQFTRLVGVDISVHALRRAKDRLRLERLAPHQQARVELHQTSLTYADARLRGFDAAALVEVIEHLDPWRLPALELAVFAVARPGTVVVTTPNAEHNVRYPGLADGAFRHDDHRFEWGRAQFRAWTDRVAGQHGYHVRHQPVGEDDAEVGPPTQMAVFTLDRAAAAEVA